MQQHGDQGVVKTVVEVTSTLQSNKSQLEQELQLLLAKHRELSMRNLANVFILSTDVKNVDEQMGELTGVSKLTNTGVSSNMFWRTQTRSPYGGN